MNHDAANYNMRLHFQSLHNHSNTSIANKAPKDNASNEETTRTRTIIAVMKGSW